MKKIGKCILLINLWRTAYGQELNKITFKFEISLIYYITNQSSNTMFEAGIKGEILDVLKKNYIKLTYILNLKNVW
jgi:hypothetical protein